MDRHFDLLGTQERMAFRCMKTQSRLTRIQVQGIGFAFIAVLLFSLSLPMTRWALESYSPLFTATGRAVIAAILAIVFLKVEIGRAHV